MPIARIISNGSNLPHPTTFSLPRPSSKSRIFEEKKNKQSNRIDLQREEKAEMMGEF